jgi:NADP-dependent 3-hydroxy acid dehydrogenase YdfG
MQNWSPKRRGPSPECLLRGGTEDAPVNLSKPAVARDIFDLNTFAAIELVRVLSKKEILHRDGASFVFLSSLSAHEGQIGNSVYAASKAALKAFFPLRRRTGAKAHTDQCAGSRMVQTDHVTGFPEKIDHRSRNRTWIPDISRTG